MTRVFQAGLAKTLTFNFWRRFLQLQLGLMIFGLAIAVMRKAGIGLDPWSVFHVGLSEQTGLSFGRITQLIGLVLLGVEFLLFGIRPGLGTILNMLLVGPWVDFYYAQAWLPEAQGLLWGIAQFMLGVMGVGLASGLYIAARFGAGPRDGFVLGLAERIKQSIRVTRGGLELTVLVLGYLLGGPPGLGTVLFALTVGQFMQFFLWLFRYKKPASKKPMPQAAD